MCAVCALWEKDKLKKTEVQNALVELLLDPSSGVTLTHAVQALKAIEAEEEQE